MNNKNSKIWLFLLGTFSMTQVRFIGNIGISELVIFFVAPFVFMQDYSLLKKDGFLPIIWLTLLTCVGCVVASQINNIPFSLFIRGFAVPYAMFGVIVVGHRLVRQSMSGYKWLCVGLALTWIINIFIFQRGVEADAWGEGLRGMSAATKIMNGPLFWIARLKNLLQIPISGWYLQTPFMYTVLAPIFMFFFSVLTSASGRSTAVAAFGSFVLVLLGGKSRRKMQSISKNIVFLLVIGVVSAELLTMAYKLAATRGMLGEKALDKYEMQVAKKGKDGVLATLMGGRIEFFYGLYVAFERPWIGYGPWALDYNDTYGDFLRKYGSDEDLRAHIGALKWNQTYSTGVMRFIGAHSHIIGFWIKYGIMGLILWLYIVGQIFRYFKKDLATIPQWYGMLAVATPSFMWNLFFSPLGDRVSVSMFIVYILMTRAVRLGTVSLPSEMELEIITKGR